jgi:hypothetical protein
VVESFAVPVDVALDRTSFGRAPVQGVDHQRVPEHFLDAVARVAGHEIDRGRGVRAPPSRPTSVSVTA